MLPRRLAKRFATISPIAIIEAPFGRVEIRETLYWHTTHKADTAHEWLKDILSR